MKKFILSSALICATTLIGACMPMGTSNGRANILDAFNNRKRSNDPKFAVLLFTAKGPSHAQDAERYMQWVQDKIQLDNVYPVGFDGYSCVYYGRYFTRAEAQQATQNMRFKRYRGEYPFKTAAVGTLPGASVGPEKWDLSKQKDGYYTAVIAYFYNMPEKNYMNRKDYAVEFCKIAREHGYEAYYYHGTTKSMVTIGLFPESAIKYVRSKVSYQGRSDTQRRTVATYNSNKLHTILDKDFPHLIVNGGGERMPTPTYDPVTRKYKRRLVNTYPVVIPGRDKEIDKKKQIRANGKSRAYHETTRPTRRRRPSRSNRNTGSALGDDIWR